MIYVTSDTHFFHDNILTFCRPYYETVVQMHEGMIKIWNDIVKPEDTIYHLGDWAFKTGQKKEEIKALRARLNGKIILILGNHDVPKRMLDFDFFEIHKNSYLEIEGIKFKLSHYPYKENMPLKDIEERPECFSENEQGHDGKRMPLLHGHTHDAFTIKPDGLCVCWDIWHKPISVDKVMEIYKATNRFRENLDKVIVSR